MTVGDIAELLQLPIQSVYKMVYAGALPVIRITPRRLRFARSDVDRWIAESTEVIAS